MIDKQLVSLRFSRAAETYHQEAVAQQQIARRMAQLLATHLHVPCRRVLEIGCGTGFLTRCLMDTLHPEHLTLNDLCPEMRLCFSDLLDSGCATFLAGDAETRSFPKEQDLIASCSVLQWFRAPEAFFDRCADWLGAEGYLAFSTFGADNLQEVAAVTGRGLHYRSIDELTHALSSRYEVLVATEEHITLTFDTPLRVLWHLKHTGVTALHRQGWTRRDLQAFSERYAALAATPEGVRLTYHPLYILARKKPLSGIPASAPAAPYLNETINV